MHSGIVFTSGALALHDGEVAFDSCENARRGRGSFRDQPESAFLLYKSRAGVKAQYAVEESDRGWSCSLWVKLRVGRSARSTAALVPEPDPRYLGKSMLVCDQVFAIGLSCVDLALHQVDRLPLHADDLVQFCGVDFVPGGGVYHTLESLASLLRCAADEGNSTVPRLQAVTLVGDDIFGRFYARRVSEDVSPEASRTVAFTNEANTALAVVPIYRDGSRGCFVDLGANRVLSGERIVQSVAELLAGAKLAHSADTKPTVLVHLAYPHLLPMLRGERLEELFRELTIQAGLVNAAAVFSVDVNGATRDSGSSTDIKKGALESILHHVDIFHANYEEACALLDEQMIVTRETSGADLEAATSSAALVHCVREHGRRLLQRLKDRFFNPASPEKSGDRLLVVGVTIGREGAWLVAGSRDDLQTFTCTQEQYIPPPSIPDQQRINANGAGDAFVAGLCFAYLRASRGRESGTQRPQRSPAAWTQFFADNALRAVTRKLSIKRGNHAIW
jgi:sugar/nucleoside kinase (ribokinase family)